MGWDGMYLWRELPLSHKSVLQIILVCMFLCTCFSFVTIAVLVRNRVRGGGCV